MTTRRETPAFTCPACRGSLDRIEAGSRCVPCDRGFPDLDDLPDLRLGGDRYLDRGADRAKASRLAGLAPSLTFRELTRAYYALTPDVDAPRRARYLAHLGRAERRGDALAALLPRSGKTLEIGCGTGGLLAAATRSGRSIVGVDLAARWLVLARSRLADAGIEGVSPIAADGARLPWADASFDAVVADSVVEHLVAPAAALREWARVVRPGGSLVLWSPNRFSIAPDPHVGLLGVGWLPTRLATRYVRARCDRRWDVRPRSPAGAAALARGGPWREVRVSAPGVPPAWSTSAVLRSSIHVYNHLTKSRITDWLPKAVGPLWQLTAHRGVG